MTRLDIALFGGYACTLRGKPIDDFVYDKVRALLAYLSVEGERAHRREYLAGLLWPDQPEDAARKSLRQALSKLRQAIDDHTARPPHLTIRHDTIQFNRQSDYCLDIYQFTQHINQALHRAPARQNTSTVASQPPVLAAESADHLQRAIDLYRGDFLEGFYLRSTPEFENWWLIERARLREQHLEALQALADHQASQGNLTQAIGLMCRYLELEPWHEEAQRCLMTWLTLNGQRTAALAQYERLRQILDDELEIEPAQETSDLYQRIRSGELTPAPHLARIQNFSQSTPPAFLGAESPAPASPPMAFVARETQMARLSQFLEAALAGRGQMAFLSSEAGWGKTSLLANFSRHAQDAHPDLIVASGICSTYKGAGDPYLPFREILRMLCGDVEGKWAAGAISRQDALRLWAFLPTSAQALVSQGRNLIDTFVPYLALLEHAQAHAGIAPELVQQIRAMSQTPHNSGVNQERILEEYLEVMMEISRQAPLLLILDDLHWADIASINLLYHLGRRLRDSAVMILGAYRPEDIQLGRDGKAHPLAPVLHEFKGLYGNIWLHLDQGGMEEGRQFVNALLDGMPNQLDDHFREQLTRNTRGRPLFIAEMLLEMQERGDLQQDEVGRWVNRAQITWDALPERVGA